MRACWITGCHFSVSAVSRAASSSGVEPTATMPMLSKFALTAGSRRAVTVSMWIFSTIVRDVLPGTKNANHPVTSKPRTPASAALGRSGANWLRLAVVTASPRTWPLLICSSIALPPICRSTRPAIVSVSAGASPRYGTCVISMPAICLNNSPARCGTVPTPGDANVTLPLFSLANAMNSATDFRRRRVRRHHQERKRAHQRDRRKIADGIRQRAIEKVAGRKGRGAHEHRVAVGVGACDRRSADVGAGAGLVLNHDLLAPDPRQPVGGDAGDSVGRSAGRIRDDDAHGAGGPGLGKRGTVDGGRKRKCRGKGNEATTVDDDCCLQSTFPRRTVTEAVGRSRE